jgi:uncharacterized protein (DUF302 family)
MPGNGLLRVASPRSVDETVQRFKSVIAQAGLQLFALIDHSGEAEKAGLEMHNTKLLIFGSPKGGTPVMIGAPSVAIDLPLKALIAEDENGKVWVSYNSPEYLKERHEIPDSLVKSISGVATLVAKSVE